MRVALQQQVGTSRVANRQTTIRPVPSCRIAASRPACQPRAAARRPLGRSLRLPAVASEGASVADKGKFISRTEVPAFIPRADMMMQLYRWVVIEAGEGGQRNFGMPMMVQPIYEDDELWGFDVSILKEGIKLTDLRVGFDLTESVEKFEWVGRGEDGFPIQDGNVTDIKGKNFEIWKLDSTPVSEDLRYTIRSFCTGLVAALNKYYAFGSVFAEEV